MALKLLKDEISKEIEAVKMFIELAVAAQKQGYLKAAQYFLDEAREDCEHAFLYAKELDKYKELESNKSITEIVQEYHNMESNALVRIYNIQKEAFENGVFSIQPFITKMMEDHSTEAYKAQKLLQQVSILEKENAIVDIESLFEELSEEENEEE
ncbi:MAG: hypothetical protein ACRCTQ_04040 [Brevinemataceae bacterium]